MRTVCLMISTTEVTVWKTWVGGANSNGDFFSIERSRGDVLAGALYLSTKTKPSGGGFGVRDMVFVTRRRDSRKR